MTGLEPTLRERRNLNGKSCCYHALIRADNGDTDNPCLKHRWRPTDRQIARRYTDDEVVQRCKRCHVSRTWLPSCHCWGF